MRRMGVAPVFLLCALLLPALNVNGSPLPIVEPSEHVTDDRVNEIKSLFNETDTNQDERVSFEEFANIPDDGHLNPEYKELLFAYADTNRDGFLSLDEYLHFFEVLADDPTKSVDHQDLGRIMNAHKLFKIYDAGEDGQISPEEALAMVEQEHSNTKSLSKLATLVLFDKADGDQDSRLKFMEFVMFLASVDDTLKKAEEADAGLLNANGTATEETVTDYMEPVEGVTGSPNGPISDSAELTDSESKTAPPEWAPFLESTTMTPPPLAEQLDKIILPPQPPLIADTSDEFNITGVNAGSSAESEDIAIDSTTAATTPMQEKGQTKPFVAGGDFMKDPPDTEVVPDTPTTPATSASTDAVDPLPQTESVPESTVDWKILTEDKLSSTEERELASIMSQMAQNPMTQTEEATTTKALMSGGNMPPAVAPVDVIEEAPSAESLPSSDRMANLNRAILEMADQDNDHQLTMAEAFDFVRVFIKVKDYLMLETLFIQNDADGDRKLNSDEFVSFLKALVDRCTDVTNDSCNEIRSVTYDEQQPSESTDTQSSTTEAPATDIPILIIEQPQEGNTESDKEKTDEEPEKESVSSNEDPLIAEMLRMAAQQGQTNGREQRPLSSEESRREPESFVPVFLIESPQEAPRAQALTPEQQSILAGLFLEPSNETESSHSGESSHSSETTDTVETTSMSPENTAEKTERLGFGAAHSKSDESSQSHESSENVETTTVNPEEFAEKMELLGFGGDVDTTTATTTQEAPVMSEESKRNLVNVINDQKDKDVEVTRVSDSDFHYFERMNDNALSLFLVAFFFVLLVLALALMVARRMATRRDKIYNIHWK